MYLYEHEGEDDFIDAEEAPLSMRLHVEDLNHSAYESPEEEPLGNGDPEEGASGGEEAMPEEPAQGGEEVQMEDEQPLEEEIVSQPIEPTIPTSAPQMKRSASSSKKKQTNLMQQLQVHMSPQQQHKYAPSTVCNYIKR